MNELDLIRALAAHDAVLDQLQRDRDALDAQLAAAEKAAADAEAAVTAARAARDAILADDRAAAREIETYEKRRATATGALERGLGDPAAAQRQIDQCSQILDDLETRRLELFEALDVARPALADAEGARDAALAARDAARVQVPAAIGALDADRATRQPDRDAARAALPKDLGLRYDLIRTKKRTAAAALQPDDTCLACRLRAPTVEAIEVRRGLLRACRGCGRFLVPPMP
jgi:predicted  nucleic acid-binding Zn-ribbon protein